MAMKSVMEDWYNETEDKEDEQNRREKRLRDTARRTKG
jgi:hypothetical protein